MQKQQLNILGGPPAFASPLPVGQLYFPEWDRYETAMRGIFERQYYNNNGPLLNQLEDKLKDFFNVRHAICVGNATFGLMMVADALQISGNVVIPSFTFIASAQSLSWTGLNPIFCDVERDSHQLNPLEVQKLISDGNVSAIMGINLWGGACDIESLSKIADQNSIPIYFDSAHSFGSVYKNSPIGSFGDAEVFSFHATKVFGATEGGCITTNNDDLADYLYTMRPSYGEHNTIDIKRVINSRMSEAQAAIALMNLEDYPKNQKNNRTLYKIYAERLSKIPGIKIVKPPRVSQSNYQYLVCEIDENEFGISRNVLVVALRAENIIARRYFRPATHRSAGFDKDQDIVAKRLPITEMLCEICMQLPLGARTTENDIHKICDVIEQCQEFSQIIKAEIGIL